MIKANVLHLAEGKQETAVVWFEGDLPRTGDAFIMHGDRDNTDYHYRVKSVTWHVYPGGPGGDRAEVTIDVDRCNHREVRQG